MVDHINLSHRHNRYLGVLYCYIPVILRHEASYCYRHRVVPSFKIGYFISNSAITHVIVISHTEIGLQNKSRAVARSGLALSNRYRPMTKVSRRPFEQSDPGITFSFPSVARAEIVSFPGIISVRSKRRIGRRNSVRDRGVDCRRSIARASIRKRGERSVRGRRRGRDRPNVASRRTTMSSIR
jgi:hypothetical protein